MGRKKSSTTTLVKIPNHCGITRCCQSVPKNVDGIIFCPDCNRRVITKPSRREVDMIDVLQDAAQVAQQGGRFPIPEGTKFPCGKKDQDSCRIARLSGAEDCQGCPETLKPLKSK